MECWWCYWGWHRKVADIYIRAGRDLRDIGCDPISSLNYGAGHIVWEDENFDQAEWCIEECDKNTLGTPAEELAIVRRSLVELHELPSEFKDEPHNGYDGDCNHFNPADFPPPPDWEMVTFEQMQTAIYKDKRPWE